MAPIPTKEGTVDRSDIGYLFKAVGALAAGVWGHFHPLMQALLVLMVLDVISGLMSAFVSKSVSSDASRRGMVKKAMALLLVGSAEVLSKNAAAISGGALPNELPLGSAVAGFFCLHEFISITENAAKAGLPMPGIITDVLKKLRGAQASPPETKT